MNFGTGAFHLERNFFGQWPNAGMQRKGPGLIGKTHRVTGPDSCHDKQKHRRQEVVQCPSSRFVSGEKGVTMRHRP